MNLHWGNSFVNLGLSSKDSTNHIYVVTGVQLN